MDSFSDNKREGYLNETIQSLDALLNDALLGEDQNGIKPNFPEGCERKDVVVGNTRVSLTYLNQAEVPQIDVVLEITYNEMVIGEYQSAYDMDGVLQDEVFYLE